MFQDFSKVRNFYLYLIPFIIISPSRVFGVENKRSVLSFTNNTLINTNIFKSNTSSVQSNNYSHYVNISQKSLLDKIRERRQSDNDVESYLAPTLPQDLRQVIVDELLTAVSYSKQKELGDQVELSCGDTILNQLQQRLPMLKVVWRINGDPLVLRASRMLFKSEDVLVIQELNPSDSGVYECYVDIENPVETKNLLPIGFFALTVMSAVPTLFPRETEQLHLNCHGHGLGRSLHTAELTLAEDPSFGCQINVPPCETINISQRTTYHWFHNGSESSDVPLTHWTPQPEIHVLKNINQSMSGVWRCETRHRSGESRLVRTWNTSWIRVHVKAPPSNLELFWKSALSRPVLVASVSFLLLVVCIGVAMLVARQTQKEDENLEVRWQTMKRYIARQQTDELCQSASFTSQMSMSTCQKFPSEDDIQENKDFSDLSFISASDNIPDK